MSEKDAKAPDLNLADHPDFKAQQEENARLKARLEQLAAKDRENEANKLVSDLKSFGFTEENGCTEFLKKARNIALSDTGETSVLLSEDDAAERPVTALGLVRELIGTLPKSTEQGKALRVQFSEIATDPLGRALETRPDLDASENERVSLSEEQLDAEYERLYGHKPNTSKES